MVFPGLAEIARLSNARTRSVSAENPTGAKSGGAQAGIGEDPHCTAAASALGKGWKVRPCLRDVTPGQTIVLADITGPGVIQHVWFTVLDAVQRWLTIRVYYDGQAHPSIECPLGDFFCNGVDGNALIASLPIAVNPKGGMNSYWPMPFRRSCRIEISNDGPSKINELFFQITYAEQDVPAEAAYLHCSWRRSMTTRERPEHVILDGVAGAGHYVGTYVVWGQLSNGWWGEGEVKFFIDGDPHDAPTICGTGTEDYFGGAWGFVMDYQKDMTPRTYTTPFLGYAQANYMPTPTTGQLMAPRVPTHALYRWHVPDPVRFQQDLRVTVQALGWWPNGKFQPLTDDIASTAWWYQTLPSRPLAPLPPIEARFAR
ncbi:MAG: DUF2961 domain-containing protein [Phycisphaeraceae bacterium]|nr:MAG: DUF2961 domain-containing protein [Phycisphaeraceae bacterium]